MEAKLIELVGRLKAGAGENLQSVVLYGSAASGEFVESHSDLNVLCVLGNAGAEELEELHDVAAWWTRQRNPAFLVFTLEELRRSADIFAIELLDMKLSHRMLYGEDFLASFEVPLHLHRLQVERELRTCWLRLRQGILSAPHDNKALLALMLDSVSTFCTLFRHALLALGEHMSENKRETLARMAGLTAADSSAFSAILDLREGKRKSRDLDVEATLHAYLEFVEGVTDEVDRRLEAG